MRFYRLFFFLAVLGLFDSKVLFWLAFWKFFSCFLKAVTVLLFLFFFVLVFL